MSICGVRVCATHTYLTVSLWSLWVVVSSGSICVGNELPCARINTVRSLTHIRFRGTHFMARRGARTHARSEEIESRLSRACVAGRGASRGGERETCRVCTLWKTGHAHARTRVRRDSLCGKSLRSHQCVSTISLKRTVRLFLRAVPRTV